MTHTLHALRAGACLLVGFTALAATAPVCRAEQFVLFDVTFTYTKQDADNSTPSKSHYYVRDDKLNPNRPRDWTSPADYRNGTVHIRTEVIQKPEGGEPTTWTLCYIPNRGQSIVWTEGIKRMDLVIKDGSGGSGHAHKRSDP